MTSLPSHADLAQSYQSVLVDGFGKDIRWLIVRIDLWIEISERNT
jgi:hypothetical protein